MSEDKGKQAETANVSPSRDDAAAARKRALANVRPEDRAVVEALLSERRGYVRRDKSDRAQAVTEQLRLRGYRE